MSRVTRPGVAAAIRARLEAHLAPGFIGITDPPTMAGPMASTAAPWTAAQIELWRDRELGWLDRSLLDGTSTPDPDRVARIGLALADTRVRDVTLVLTVRQGRTEQVAGALSPVATSLPQPWRAPTGAVLALCEWINGRDPITVLNRAAPGPGYALADLTRRAHAVGATADQASQWATGATLAEHRYGAKQVDVARVAEADQTVVLGEALHRAGWSLHVSTVDADTGQLVGYLLRDHTRVAVVEAHGLIITGDGQIDGAGGSLTFSGNSADAGDWRAVVGNAGVSDGGAVAALLHARGLDLAYPQAAARVATSPTVLARTDQLIATGPTRGPRLT